MKFFTDKSPTPSKEKVTDVKKLLKLSRKYIDENNFKEAEQCCKKVLRINSRNYTALVLLGKSYGHSDDAVLSYEKAIKIKPDAPLAWQGLACYYEANEDRTSKEKLMSIYDKILTLNIDDDYANKTLKKYGQLGCILKPNNTISTLVQYTKRQNNNNLIKTAKTQIVHLLKSKVSCKLNDIADVKHILKTHHSGEDHSDLVVLAELIFQTKEFKSAMEEVVQLKEFPRSEALPVWVCKVLFKTFMTKNTLYGFDIKGYVRYFMWGMQYSREGCNVIGIYYYCHSMFELAYRKCYSGLRDYLNSVEDIEVLFLINCSNKTSNRTRTINLCNYFLSNENSNNPAILKTVKTVLLSCFIAEKNINKSLHCLKKIPAHDMDSILLTDLGDLYFESDITDEVTWEILDSSDYIDLFKGFANIKSRKINEAIEILQVYDKHPLKYYYLAIAYWFIDSNEESLENFQIAAGLIVNHPKIYYSLGIHYYHKNENMEESQKYFELSYELCKTDINIIRMLAVIYEKKGLVDSEFNLLKAALATPQTKKFWVCERLGRICYDKGIMDEALSYMQTAMSIQPQEITALEFIGDIYFNKKDYKDALTAYQKVVDQTEDKEVQFTCLNKMGSIYSELMSHFKATTIYDKVLDEDPGNYSALQGLTENRVIFALKFVAHNLFKVAREQMQRAINRIIKAIALGSNDLTCYMFHGDVLVYMSKLPDEYTFVNLQSSEGVIRKEKLDLYKMAIESYSNLMKFRDPSALFKCAVTYYEYYCETKNIGFCKTSYNLSILYIKINPNVWNIWDLLGKICYHLNKHETAYYYFSKALNMCDENELDMWHSLELFYKKLNEEKLANYENVIERFDLSTFTPTLLKEECSGAITNENENSEINNVNSLNIEDADKRQFTEWIRNFHPSTDDQFEPTFDCPIESFKIIPNAYEIIEWYLCFEEETAWSCCSLGNLQERKGSFISALRYYDRAYDIAQTEMKNEILSHKARVLMTMQEYEEAVNVYNTMGEKNLQEYCALAGALYKLDKYKECYAAYNIAFNNLCENDNQRIDILIDMSNVAYRFNGLHCGAVLLLRAVKIKYGEEQDFNLPFLITFVLKKIDIQLASYILSVYLHKYIDKASWWYYMGLNYLRGINKHAKLSRACMKRALRLNTLSRRKGRLLALFSVTEFYSGNRQRALNLTMKAVRKYPVQPELWATYILCIYSRKTWPHRAYFLRCLINTVRTSVNVSESLDNWLTKVEEEVFDEAQ